MNEANNHVDRVVTAALLHDIGKFWSRTGAAPPFTSQESDHFSTYAHALWSAHFVEQYVQDAEIARWVREHHRPGSIEAQWIQLADWLASGERTADAGEVKGRPSEAALVSPLSQITLEDGETRDTQWRLPLTEHGQYDADSFFPRRDTNVDHLNYEALWAGFVEQAAALPPGNTASATWQTLLCQYASRIPAATPTRVGSYVPDISLYDHCRVTAAVTACLAAAAIPSERMTAIRDALQNNIQTGGGTTPLFRLVCGDLSGIQTFLYTTGSRRAAKTLRGRSFALQLVAERCAHSMCELAGVPATCILYCGGGRFYLLLPLGAPITELAADLRWSVHHAFHGALTVVLGETDLAPVDLVAEDTSNGRAWRRLVDKWREIGRIVSEARARRFTDLARQDFQPVFDVFDEGGELGRCSACGNEADELRAAEEGLDDLEPTRYCPECDQYIELGEQLRDARWLVRYEVSADVSVRPGFEQFLAHTGGIIASIRNRDDLDPRWRIMESQQFGRLDVTETLAALRPPGDVSLTSRPHTHAWPKNREGRIATFEELAASSTGVTRLAILRADVDNLGAVFQRGLRDRATLGRVGALSAAFSDFFTGYVAHLASEQFADTVGVVYAGGDDLFIVGAWDKVIEYALALHDAFHRYGGENPALTLSAGVAIVDDHLPLRHAAEMAADAEETAKGYERNTLQKNALTLFGVPVGFEEIEPFLAFRDGLRQLLESDNGLPRSFLRRLFDIWEVYQAERERTKRRAQGEPMSLDELKRQAQWQRWRWMLTYGLREFTKKGHDERIRQGIEDIQQRMLNGSIEDRLGLPLRWVELLTREERDQ